MPMKINLLYVTLVVIGFFLSYILQNLSVNDFVLFVQWLKFDAKQNNETSLALLTLVDHKQKSFGVTVIPPREIKENRERVINAEASIFLRKAISLQNEGEDVKALKLLKQSKALSPRNPDVLNLYGESIESQDIISAEHHYALALVIYPGHSRARANKHRCSPRVKEIDLKMLRRIETKRNALMEIPEGNSALNRAKLEAYYKHIYHSNGIEGNTMTLSMTRAIVETGMAVGGKSVIEHNEVLGMDAALKYINTTLLNEPGPVNIEHILQIHKRVLGYTHPMDAGLYRQSQVYVGDHKPPDPLDMLNYMDAFQLWLQSSDVTLLHPIELAALAHYKLVYIHPFIDGNGRTSRLLMNLFLMRAGYPPVIIRKEQRYEYYELLQTANVGDVRPFIRFVARCTENTLDEYLSSVTVRQLQHEDSKGDLVSITQECFNPFAQASSLTQNDAIVDQTKKKCAKGG